MPREDSTWVEYDPAGPTIVRTFGSEVAALRVAVKETHQVTKVHYGETITEALERQANADQTPAEPPAGRAPRRRTPPTTPAADPVVLSEVEAEATA